MYTLWHNPGIVPLLHTGANVIARLQGGADLMIPGLVGGPPFPEKAKKGAMVAIAGHDSPSVPMAVGTCEVDVSALQQVRGEKGHAVQNVHWSGDEIWAWSASGNPGVAPPEHIAGWIKQDSEMAELQQQTEDLDIEEADSDQEGGVPLPPTDAETTNGNNEEEHTEVEAKELTTQGRFAASHSWLHAYICRNRRCVSECFSIRYQSLQIRQSKDSKLRSRLSLNTIFHHVNAGQPFPTSLHTTRSSSAPNQED